jgi:hypothetical protein
MRGGCRRRDAGLRRVRGAAGAAPTKWPGSSRSARGCRRGRRGHCRPRGPRPARRRSRHPAAASHLSRDSRADAWPRQDLGQLAQDPAEPAGGCPVWHMAAVIPGTGIPRDRAGVTGLAGTRGAGRARPSWAHGRRARRLAGTVLRNGDGQHVPGCGDGEPEHGSRPRRAYAARCDRPPQRCGVCHRAAREAAAADLSNPVPGDPRSPAPCRSGSPTTTGEPAAACSSPARISPRRPAQYESYFDVTPPVCSGTRPKATLPLPWRGRPRAQAAQPHRAGKDRPRCHALS